MVAVIRIEAIFNRNEDSNLRILFVSGIIRPKKRNIIPSKTKNHKK
jgi:hypothetical protein